MLSDSLYEANFGHGEVMQVLRAQVQRMGNQLPLNCKRSLIAHSDQMYTSYMILHLDRDL